jgi:hypothetical protein
MYNCDSQPCDRKEENSLASQGRDLEFFELILIARTRSRGEYVIAKRPTQRKETLKARENNGTSQTTVSGVEGFDGDPTDLADIDAAGFARRRAGKGRRNNALPQKKKDATARQDLRGENIVLEELT